MLSWCGVWLLLIRSLILGNEAMKTEMVSYCFMFVREKNMVDLYFSQKGG